MPCSVSIAAQFVSASGRGDASRRQDLAPRMLQASQSKLCMAVLCASSYQVCQVWRGDRQLLLSRKRRAEVGFKAATPLALGSAPHRAQVPWLPAACRRLGAKAAKSSEIHRYQAPRPERQRPCGRSSRPAVGQRLRKARLGDGLTFLLQTRSRCRKAIREARGRGVRGGGDTRQLCEVFVSFRGAERRSRAFWPTRGTGEPRCRFFHVLSCRLQPSCNHHGTSGFTSGSLCAQNVVKH